MMNRHFADQLIDGIKRTSCLVVGIDPNFDLMPSFLLPEKVATEAVYEALVNFSRLIVEAVSDLIPAIKFQSAFYEQFGHAGIRALASSIQLVKKHGLLVVLDCKRGDIGSTSQAYANGYLAGHASLGNGRFFDSDLGVDCVTMNPFLGEDSVTPFVDTATRHGSGVFILVKTSNPGSGLFMDSRVNSTETISQRLAHLVTKWGEPSVGESGYSCIGAVVGATYPEEAATLRALMPHAIFLAPGVGTQGGTIETTRACFDSEKSGAIVPISRAITYPTEKTTNEMEFRKAVRNQVVRYNALLRESL
jgi:orotidine-5'-phosphate decarboxylase